MLGEIWARHLVVKLQFFSSVSKLLQPFMEIYQSDKHLLPFLADIFLLIKNCLNFITNVIKADTLSDVTSKR